VRLLYSRRIFPTVDGVRNSLGPPDSFEQPCQRNPPGLHRFRQMLVDLRDAVQKEIARGASKDQAAAAIKLPQYEQMQGYQCRAADVPGNDGHAQVK